MVYDRNNLQAHLFTLDELAKVLEDAKETGTSVTFLSPKSLETLASWLKELNRSRSAIYQARVALADADRK